MSRNCILISSYHDHKPYLDKFLYTIQKNTPNNLPIYIVISKDDESEFTMCKNLLNNVNLIIFSKIVELLDDKIIDEDILLKEYGKYNYQSLKKYYGLYYLFYSNIYDNIIIFDSESIIVKNIDVNNLINKYIEDPFLIYSETDNKNNVLHTQVDLATRDIIKIQEPVGWFLEYYLWIYEKKLFTDFMQYIIQQHEKSMIDVFKQYDNIFFEILYQLFIYKNNIKYKYNIINFSNYIERQYQDDVIKENVIKIIRSISPLKPIEDCREFIEHEINEDNGNKCNFIKIFYNIHQLALYKTKDSEKSLEFVKNMECIKICASEYSDKIFNYYFPSFIKDLKLNSAFILKNIITMENDSNSPIYKLIKRKNVNEPFHWLGYEINAPPQTKIKFSFELMFQELKNINHKNYIAFKRHIPQEIHRIPLNTVILNQWKKYVYTVNINDCASDLCIIIFDDAPKCHVLIRNFIFEVIK